MKRPPGSSSSARMHVSAVSHPLSQQTPRMFEQPCRPCGSCSEQQHYNHACESILILSGRHDHQRRWAFSCCRQQRPRWELMKQEPTSVNQLSAAVYTVKNTNYTRPGSTRGYRWPEVLRVTPSPPRHLPVLQLSPPSTCSYVQGAEQRL